MYRNLVNALMVTLLFIAPTSAIAAIVPAGLAPGAPYHLVFVTEGTHAANTADINNYNTFVQSEAERVGSLTENLDVDWFAIGSTSSVNARDNAVVGANVPVYLLDGTTKVADGYADMWDGDIDHAIDFDQFSNISGLYAAVHSGTKADGTNMLALYLGKYPSVSTGRADLGAAYWIAAGGTVPWDSFRPLYALSEQLTVIPEPTTACLLTCGLLAVLGSRRKS